MTKTVILGIAVAAVLIAGLIAFTPIQEASSQGRGSNPLERDNTTVTTITLASPQRLVLVDNAGIGGTSDVEVTWRFNPTNCGLNRVDTPAGVITLSTFSPAGDDGALGGNPAHNDEKNVKGIVLFAKSGMTCTLNPANGEFVTVSTIASGP